MTPEAPGATCRALRMRRGAACPEAQAPCLSRCLCLWLILELMGMTFLSILLPLGWQDARSLPWTPDLPAAPAE